MTNTSVTLYDLAMLDAHRLRVFRAVVAAGSINGAAASLGYTPSAVSQHLAALQRETGLVLVERNGRGIVPTPAGRLFAEESRHALERLAALESVAADLRAGRIGRLTISYFASAGSVWVPPVAAALSREFPRLRLDLRLIERAAESPFVPDVELFVEGCASTSLDGYDVCPLIDEPYLAVLSGHHALAGETSVRLGDLRDEAWIDNDVVPGPCRQIVLDACASKGFTPSFQVEAQDYASAIAFVAAAGGLTVVPRVATRSLPDGLVAVPVVDPVPQRRIVLRVRRTVAENDAVRRAAELLKTSVPA
jgi:DNA-binding transcriptional LysR family regulator